MVVTSLIGSQVEAATTSISLLSIPFRTYSQIATGEMSGDYRLSPGEWGAVLRNGHRGDSIGSGSSQSGDLVQGFHYTFEQSFVLDDTFGTATVFINGRGTPVGMYDLYNFDFELSKTRSNEGHILTGI